MATTMTNHNQTRCLENNANCTLSRDNATATATSLSETCIVARLSKWLWFCRKNPPTDGATALTPTDENAEDGLEKNAFPCRACQVQGVQCDRLKPRCAHCLDQQILCFYVEPLRVTMKRSKEEQARALAGVQGSAVTP
ncbi:hypothetical protein BDV06DRAFT_218335 [Aspergillus oleicola]